MKTLKFKCYKKSVDQFTKQGCLGFSLLTDQKEHEGLGSTKVWGELQVNYAEGDEFDKSIEQGDVITIQISDVEEADDAAAAEANKKLAEEKEAAERLAEKLRTEATSVNTQQATTVTAPVEDDDEDDDDDEDEDEDDEPVKKAAKTAPKTVAKKK